MNGAHALLRTLVASGVDTCFTNPGTSEMHFVAALDDVPEMRAVLTLFEGVATGAADGYARMAGGPAATLLHLGPGLGNGLANLHNARRARTPVVNIVGDHATFHAQYDAPLASDIEGVARNVSRWVRTCTAPEAVGRDATDAIVAALSGGVATLILPADASWLDGAEPGPIAAQALLRRVPSDAIELAVKALQSDEPAALLLGGSALDEAGLVAAARCGRRDGRQAVVRDVPGALGARRGAARGRPAGIPRRIRDRAAGRAEAPRPRRYEGSGVVLRVSRQAELPRARRLRSARARAERLRRRACARGARRRARRGEPTRAR